MTELHAFLVIHRTEPDQKREIAENLHRANLTALERDTQVALTPKKTKDKVGIRPYDIELGLARGDVSKPSDAWRQVLGNGLPEPVPLKRPALAMEPINMVRSMPGDDDVPGPRSSDVQLR